MKEIKGAQLRKEEVNISRCAENMILYIRDPQRLHQESPRAGKHCSKGSRLIKRLTHQKLLAFLYTKLKRLGMKTETIPLAIATKIK